jgi:hypothetical protein
MARTSDVWRQQHVVASNVDDLNVAPVSDTSSIDHLVMSEFVSGSPRYYLAIKVVREQFVILDQKQHVLASNVDDLTVAPVHMNPVVSWLFHKTSPCWT